MKPRPETTIKRQILRFLKSLPSSNWEASPPGSTAGKLDITGYLKGRYVELEVKKPGGKLTRLQAWKINKLRTDGVVTGVVCDVDDTIAILIEHGLYKWVSKE